MYKLKKIPQIMEHFSVEQRKDFEKFVKWRDKELQKSSEICSQHDYVKKIMDEKSAIIKDVPKCLVHLTRKMCNCKSLCVSDSFLNTHINFNCKKYDLENPWYDDKYLNCHFLDKKVQNSTLINGESNDNLLQTIFEFNKGLVKLCDKDSDFDDLLCKAYDLRDGCQNLQDCIEFYLKKIPRRICNNPYYLDQVDEIERVLDLPIRSDEQSVLTYDYDLFYEIDPDCVPVDLIESFPKIKEENNTENRNITKRELNVFDKDDLSKIIKGYQILEAKFSNTDSTICQQRVFYTMISLSLLSTVILCILSYFGYKDKDRNGKITVPSVVITLSLLFISIYTSLTIDN